MKPLYLMLCALWLVSCPSRNEATTESTPTKTPPYYESLERERASLERQRQEEEKSKADFDREYQRYQSKAEDVPEVEESTGSGRSFRSMHFGDHLALKLDLGALVRVNGAQSGPMRTKSRYRLLWDEKPIAAAESLFSVPSAVGDERTSNRFIYNSADQSLLVFEELCWSTMRYILFERGLDSKWTAKYFWLPSRPIFGSPVNHEGKIHGIGNGKIFMEIDGQIYAFPVDNFLEEKLEFTVG